MTSKTAEQIALEQMARESGMLEQKDRTLQRARMFCNAPADSAVINPTHNYRQGQIKTADELLRFLEGK
jgi:phage anti-repressor protein